MNTLNENSEARNYIELASLIPGVITDMVDNNKEINRNVANIYVTGICGDFTIDWGDGSEIETHKLSDNPNGSKNFNLSLQHDYSDANFRNITLSGENITHLRCVGTRLTSLEVSACTALASLNCSGNKLTYLDVSECTALTSLNCSGNKLTSLDVSACTALIALRCYRNKLTNLDMSACVELTKLDCHDNQLTSSALNTLFETLCYSLDYYDKIPIYDNPGAADCNASIAEDKGWTVFVKAKEFEEQLAMMVGNNMNNEELELMVVKAYLVEGMSYRDIEKNVYQIDAPIRGGGLRIMKKLHKLGIKSDKKGRLQYKFIQKEIESAKGKYLNTLLKYKNNL